MFGEPEDVEGKCRSRIYISDNFGDNHCTICCDLPVGHSGLHARENVLLDNKVFIQWENDERESYEKSLEEIWEDD